MFRWSRSDEDIISSKLLPPSLIKPVEVVNFEKGVFSAPVSTSFTSGPSTAAASANSVGNGDLSSSSIASPLFPSSRVFKHELLQSFSFHLFAKRPVLYAAMING